MDLDEAIASVYRERTPSSERAFADIGEYVPAGVASTHRAWNPYPFVVERAEGAYLYDVDGNAYLDHNLCHGAGMVGHAHPTLVEAVSEQLTKGTLFTHPHEGLREAAAELTKRWDCMDAVRFTNSGTESTMHAIRLARAYTGKDKILKIEGSYHGVHDYVLVSTSMSPPRKLGHPKRPSRVVDSGGIPEAVAETVEVAPFNDADALADILDEHRSEIAAVIVEPVMLNVGVTAPQGEYLQAVRELCDEHNVVYIFDEVKTGVKVAPGGAAEYYGVTPDLVTVAKSIGGLYPVGAFGGREDIMSLVADNTAAHFGTYNGSPLVTTAVVTTLRDILTDEAYAHVDRLGERLVRGYEDIMADHGITGRVDHVNSQGIVSFTDPDETFPDYRSFMAATDYGLHENYFFAMLNEGVLPHPHSPNQQWTVSVQHTDEDVDAHLDAFETVAPTVAEKQAD